MKRIIGVVLIIFTIALGAFAVNADSVDRNTIPSERGHGHMRERSCRLNEDIHSNNQERRESRNEMREERIKEALEKGLISEDEVNAGRSHFHEMDKFHEEKEFRGGHCQDEKRGKRHGHGMMRGMMRGRNK